MLVSDNSKKSLECDLCQYVLEIYSAISHERKKEHLPLSTSPPTNSKISGSNAGQRKLQSILASAQRVPEPDPLPGISFDTRPDSVLEIIG